MKLQKMNMIAKKSIIKKFVIHQMQNGLRYLYLSLLLVIIFVL